MFCCYASYFEKERIEVFSLCWTMKSCQNYHERQKQELKEFDESWIARVNFVLAQPRHKVMGLFMAIADKMPTASLPGNGQKCLIKPPWSKTMKKKLYEIRITKKQA